MSQLFDNEATFKIHFISGLCHLLHEYPSDHSSRVLVLANTGCSEEVAGEFSDDELSDAFSLCAGLYKDSLKRGTASPSCSEDILIFSEVEKRGIPVLRERSIRSVGKLCKVFNTIRGLRPMRMAGARIESIFQPFDESFNFLLPTMEKECFWRSTVDGISLTAMYNKFPTAPYHFLLLPERDKKYPQILTEEIHRSISALVRGAGCDNLIAGYNSAGAYASVGHLHFQVALDKKDFPVTYPCWKINGGAQKYHAYCRVFESHDHAWKWIQSLHESDVAYNLVYSRDAIYGFARLKQGYYSKSPGMPDFAFSEMGGRLIFTDREAFKSTDLRKIKQELRKLSLDI